MHDVLPIYCETALNPSGAFPAEPINALTSFFPFIMGVLAIWYLWRTGNRGWIPWILAILTAMTGLGSVAWHAHRTPFTLLIDALPGVIYFSIMVAVWMIHISNRWIALTAGVALVAFIFLVPLSVKQQYQIPMIGFFGLLALGLLFLTWRRQRPAFVYALPMVGCGLAAAAFRTLDLHVCDVMPVGTHFFWHLFLGTAAYLGVRMMVVMERADERAR